MKNNLRKEKFSFALITVFSMRDVPEIQGRTVKEKQEKK
jgi:hypothetical protein